MGNGLILNPQRTKYTKKTTNLFNEEKKKQLKKILTELMRIKYNNNSNNENS